MSLLENDETETSGSAKDFQTLQGETCTPPFHDVGTSGGCILLWWGGCVVQFAITGCNILFVIPYLRKEIIK